MLGEMGELTVSANGIGLDASMSSFTSNSI
jgi:hypothetical protein